MHFQIRCTFNQSSEKLKDRMFRNLIKFIKTLNGLRNFFLILFIPFFLSLLLSRNKKNKDRKWNHKTLWFLRSLVMFICGSWNENDYANYLQTVSQFIRKQFIYQFITHMPFARRVLPWRIDNQRSPYLKTWSKPEQNILTKQKHSKKLEINKTQ